MGNFMEKNDIVSDQMIPNCLIWQEKAKNIRRETAVPLPFLHSFILYLFKATAMPNSRAVTLYLVEFFWFWFQKVSLPPHTFLSYNFAYLCYPV